MKRLAFRPSINQLKLLAVLTVVSLMLNILFAGAEAVATASLILFAAIITLAVLDLFSARKRVFIEVTRDVPTQLSFNRWQKVRLTVKNHHNQSLQFQCMEHLPAHFEVRGLASSYDVAAQASLIIECEVKSLKRGPATISATELCILSPLKFWQVYWLVENPTPIKIYPDFKRLAQSQSLHGVSNLPINGLKQMKKRGEGIEFHQLRDFRQGDSQRQIDWQATSKRRKLISREYQEEQNQHIIVMLDAGYRMNSQTELGSHFDAALNALLMLGHTVLKQGDWFSMQSFNQKERWLAAIKGAQNVSQVMNHFYDLEPDESESDYISAVTNLLKKRSKRSLVLLVTTLNDQDFQQLLPALKRLQQHHLVALVNIENVALSQSLEEDIGDLSDAHKYCAAVELKNLHTANIKRLRKEGIICVDTKPEHLLPHVVNTYLNVKHSGML